MFRTNLKLVRGIFGALVVGSLGFGARQAFASPTVAAATERCTMLDRQSCNDGCFFAGWSGGRCVVVDKIKDCQCF